MTEQRRLFGTDGIRGRANQHPITPDVAMRVGMAAGLMYRNGNGDHHRVVIGKDTRLSSYMVENALTAGFLSVGLNVLLTGPIPTPGIAMLTRSMRCDLGVMISASHNAFEDNGIKLFGPDGFKLSDAREAEIEALVGSDLARRLAEPSALGRARRIDGASERYIEYAKRTLPRDLSLEGMRVVVDCANGAGYAVAPKALEELGAEVFAIGVEPNGFNINREVGSTSTAALIAEVKARRADIGIALDGDADRVVIVDEKGQFVDGDQLLAVIAASWAEDGRLAKPAIVVTVMSNLGLERYLKGIGVGLVRTQVGDRYVGEAMRGEGYNLGGEQSGHIIMSDYTTTGDGLVAAMQLLAVVKKLNRPVSEVCHRFEPVPQILEKVPIANGERPLENSRVKDKIEAVRKRLAERGRLVIRASGTEPVVRVMAEGDDRSMIEEVVAELVSVLRDAAAAPKESGRRS